MSKHIVGSEYVFKDYGGSNLVKFKVDRSEFLGLILSTFTDELKSYYSSGKPFPEKLLSYLERILEEVPNETLYVLYLRDVEGLPLREIGRVLGKSHSTIGNRIRATLSRLKGLFLPTFEELYPKGLLSSDLESGVVSEGVTTLTTAESGEVEDELEAVLESKTLVDRPHVANMIFYQDSIFRK